MRRTIPRQRLKLLPPTCTANAAARILGVPQPTLLAWIRYQGAPAVQEENRRWRLDKVAVSEWLARKNRLRH